MRRQSLSVDQRLGLAVGAALGVGIAAVTLFAFAEMRGAAIGAARQRLGDVTTQLAAMFEQSGRARTAALERIASRPEVVEYLRRTTAPESAGVGELLDAADVERNSSLELWDGAGRRVLQAGAPRPPLRGFAGRRRRGGGAGGGGGGRPPPRLPPGHGAAEGLRPVMDEAQREVGFVVQRQPVASSATTRDRLSRLVGQGARVYVGSVDNRTWTDFATHVAGPPVPVRGDTTLLSYVRAGTGGQLAMARELGGIPWVVLAEFPRDEVLARTHRFLRDAGIAAVLLIGLVGALGWTYLRRVTRPIEGALQESEARFEAILEGTPNGVVMVDADGRMVFVNHEVERLFGYGREELLGQPVERLIPERFAAGHPRLRRDAMHLLERREMGADRDLFARRRDGSEFPVVVGLNPVRRNGQSYVVTSVVDISARKDAERELKRSNDELQRFAYVASHDLQEPLRTVASYVQLLERRYGDRFDADGREFMAFVVDGARRMQRMVDDLLTLSRVGSHGVELVPVPADEVLDRAIDDLKLALEESGATVTRAPLPVVRGDARQLEQLFANLIGNALKFAGPTAPRIEVGARREGAEWVISVRDHGIGIEPQYFDRIFVIFQRLHGRDEYPGTGIGLAICKKIVERHGGRIWVDSQPGAGSTFHFTLAAPQEG